MPHDVHHQLARIAIRNAQLVCVPRVPVATGRHFYPEAALGSLAIQLQRLYAAGARHFLVWNVPDISLAPAVRKLDTELLPQQGIAQLASSLSQGFNAGLAPILAQFDALAGVDVTTIDVFQLLHEVVAANGSGFGLTNVTDACIMPNTPPFQCQRPREYLFWMAFIRHRRVTSSLRSESFRYSRSRGSPVPIPVAEPECCLQCATYQTGGCGEYASRLA